MSFDDEQCPKRGPGLTHIFDDGLTCDSCGVVNRPKSALEWWAEMLRSLRPASAVVVEPQIPHPDEPAFALLTATQWHHLIVERRFHESHDCDDRL